jgi:hypothetical protein
MLSDIKAPHHVYTCPFCYTIKKPTIKSHLHYGNGLNVQCFGRHPELPELFRPLFHPQYRRHPESGLDQIYFPRILGTALFLFDQRTGQPQTFRNDWVGIGFHAVLPEHPNGLKVALSFGWLAHSEGNYFNPKPAFRLSPFIWQHGPFHIGPAMYFDHFFKDVTPSIRFSFLGF